MLIPLRSPNDQLQIVVFPLFANKSLDLLSVRTKSVNEISGLPLRTHNERPGQIHGIC